MFGITCTMYTQKLSMVSVEIFSPVILNGHRKWNFYYMYMTQLEKVCFPENEKH